MSCFSKMRVTHAHIEVDTVPARDNPSKSLKAITGTGKMPWVFIGGEFVGGDEELVAGLRNGAVQGRLKKAGVAFREIGEE